MKYHNSTFRLDYPEDDKYMYLNHFRNDTQTVVAFTHDEIKLLHKMLMDIYED